MIDLVITVLILSIVSAIVVPRFTDTLSNYRVRTAAQQIAADLNYAREYAGQASRDLTVTFTVAPPTYQLVGVPNLNESGGDFIVALNDEGYDVTLTSVDFDGETDLVFNPYGLASSGSPATPVVSGQIVVQSGTHTRTVRIDPGTGKAVVQ